MTKDNNGFYLLLFSEIALILLMTVFFHLGYYLFGVITLIGVFGVWLFENDNINIYVVWSFLIIGIFEMFFLFNFLGSILMIILAIFTINARSIFSQD